jgi:hypothetical protein
MVLNNGLLKRRTQFTAQWWIILPQEETLTIFLTLLSVNTDNAQSDRMKGSIEPIKNQHGHQTVNYDWSMTAMFYH